MKLYKLSQRVCTGYDTYNDCVVCAEDEESAKRIHPDGYKKYDEDNGFDDMFSRARE